MTQTNQPPQNSGRFNRAFPLELKEPNAQTRAAMEEARAMAKARTARFEFADALIDDLEKARQQ